jgi:hypothetical protein
LFDNLLETPFGGETNSVRNHAYGE